MGAETAATGAPGDGDEPLRLFVGYDRRETVAYHVLSHSLQTRSSTPLAIAPLMLSQLAGVLTRARHPLQSTDFAFSRFLVPYLSGYRGWSLYMDCDMLARADIAELWRLRDERYRVMVVQHDYQPSETEKFLRQPQTRYQKKNWSSVMLFNNARCRALTPAYVNAESGLQLHQFHWAAGGEADVGALPTRWNHLAGVYPWRDDAALVHFTAGGPYFDDYADCHYADEWRAQRAAAYACQTAPDPPP